MSFIYEDEKLIKELVALAQIAAPVKPVAPTKPVTTNTLPDPRVLETAKQLVKSLQAQFNGGSVFTAERDDAAVRTIHLQNLSSLLNFLSFNGIHYNGMPLVVDYTGQSGMGVSKKPSAVVFDTFDAAKKAMYAPYPNAENIQYYINKNGLIAYLRDLQSKSNLVLNAMVSKLIDQVNSELQLNMPKEAPEAESTPQLKGNLNMHSKNPGATPSAATDTATAMQLLSQVIEELPFDTQDLDFNRINKFFDTYKRLISGPNVQESRKAPVLQAIQQAQDSMRNAQSTTQIARTNFPMYNLTPNMVQSWLKPPQGQYYDSLLQALLGVANNTEYVVRDLYNAYARRASSASRVTLNPEQENLVQQQIVGNSKYRSNFNAIRQMASRLGEVKQGK